MLAGCTASARQDPDLLTVTPWAAVQYRAADGSLSKPVPGNAPTISFDAGRKVSGNGGVNSFRSDYMASKSGRMYFNEFNTTLMAGPEPLMEQESAYLAGLAKVATYEVSDETLRLLDAGGDLVVSYVPLESTALEGTGWTCTGYNNGQEAFVSIAAGTEMTARFESGELSGSTGVNTYRGPYTLSGTTLRIGALSATEKAGEPEAMEQESAYLATMPLVARYEIEGTTLTLLSAEGLRLATYSAATE